MGRQFVVHVNYSQILSLFLVAAFSVELVTCDFVQQQQHVANANAASASSLLVKPGGDLPIGQQQAGQQAVGQTGSLATGVTDQLAQQRYQQWQLNALYVPPFDPKIISIPNVQLEFVRDVTGKDLMLYRQIINEAIETRRKFAPSVKLMLKYTGKILGNFIKNRRAEQKITDRIEPAPEFFSMLANLAQAALDRSAQLKRERGYTKDNIDTEAFRSRVQALLDYVQRIINNSPLGGYLKWDTLKLYADEPQNPLHKGDLIEETADLIAQFRAMGYESSSFVARRIVNLLRMFSRGVTPSSEKDV